MVVIDAHTHIYPSHVNSLTPNLICHCLRRLAIFKPTHLIIVLAQTNRTVSFQDVASKLNALINEHPVRHFVITVNGVKVTFVHATQITDLFGCEFTVIGESVFLTSTPLKYSRGMRRKIHKMYAIDGSVISTPLDPYPMFFVGSDVLPYPSDIQNILASGSLWSRFDLDNFFQNPISNINNFLGTFNFFTNRLLRFLMSQRFVTRFSSWINRT